MVLEVPRAGKVDRAGRAAALAVRKVAVEQAVAAPALVPEVLVAVAVVAGGDLRRNP